jgi:predicted nucleotide-binding protein
MCVLRAQASRRWTRETSVPLHKVFNSYKRFTSDVCRMDTVRGTGATDWDRSEICQQGGFRMKKRRLLILSSREWLRIAYAVQESLEHDAEVTVWEQDVFRPSHRLLESLLKKLKKIDVGVFVLSPDDLVTSRGVRAKASRDNVVFELGLFSGAIGYKRAIMLIPRLTKPMRLPAYVADLTPVTFESRRMDHNLQAALGPACNRIRLQIKRIRPRRH